MAGMTTVLKEFQDAANSRTFTRTGHTVQAPKLVLQKRKIASGNAIMAEDSLTTVSAAHDSGSVLLPNRITFSAVIRRPAAVEASEVTAELAVFRDLVASDEFAQMVTSQDWVKN